MEIATKIGDHQKLHKTTGAREIVREIFRENRSLETIKDSPSP